MVAQTDIPKILPFNRKQTTGLKIKEISNGGIK